MRLQRQEVYIQNKVQTGLGEMGPVTEEKRRKRAFMMSSLGSGTNQQPTFATIDYFDSTTDKDT